MSDLAPAPSSPLRRDWQLALGIFAVALLLRLVYLAEVESHPFMRFLLVDAQSYDDWARRIAGGDWWGDAVFYQAPAYPYFLAGIYAVFGADLWTAHMVQMFLGATSCLLMFFAARNFFDLATGVAAGLLLALYPPAIFFDSIIQKAGLGLFLLCGLLLAIALFQRSPRVRTACSVGAILGVLALTRENALVFVAAIPVWIAIRFRESPLRSRLQWLIAFVLGVVLVLLPVALRNFSVGDSFALTTSQLGPNFYIGNHSGATGSYSPLLPGRQTPEYEGPDAKWLAEQQLGRELSAAEVSRYWLGEGLAFIRNEPTEWIALMLAKTLMTFNDFEAPDTEDIYGYAEHSRLLAALLRVHHFGILIPLAFLGMLLARKRGPDVWIHYALIGVYALSVIVFYVFARYRYPLVPLMLPLAGFGLVEAVRIARHREWSRLSVPAIAVFMVAILANRSLYDEAPYRAVSYGNLAYIMLKENRFDEAEVYLIEAEAANPEDMDIQFQIAALRYQQNRPEDAIQVLRAILEVEKLDHRPHLLLAKILFERGDMKASRHHRLESVRLNPARNDGPPRPR